MEQLDFLWDYQKLDLMIDEIKSKKKNSSVKKELFRTIKYLKNQKKNLVKINNDVDKKNHIYNRIYYEFENINNGLIEEEEILNSGDIKSFKQLDQMEKRISDAQEKLKEKEGELTTLLKDMEATNKKLQAISGLHIL